MVDYVFTVGSGVRGLRFGVSRPEGLCGRCFLCVGWWKWWSGAGVLLTVCALASGLVASRLGFR